MRKLLPLLIALLALAGGVGAGMALRPPPAEPDAAMVTTPAYPVADGPTEVLRLPSNFLIPLLSEGRVRAMVVVALALELVPEHGIDLARHEARLRAIFLQMLFDYANLGGFDGVFTAGEQLLTLRRSLLEAARLEFGDKVHDVLIVDLLRQES